MFEKYAAFNLEDFVHDEYFIKWVHSPDPEKDQFWSDFQENFPYQRNTLLRAREVVRNLNEASRKAINKSDAREIWQNLEKSLPELTQTKKWWQTTWSRSVAAAVALLTLAYTTFQYTHTDTPDDTSLYFGNSGLASHAKSDIKEITNDTDTIKTIALPDQSTVLLEPRSTLRYSAQFDNEPTRNVILVGAAFFDIKRDVERPFIVYANGLITKVLGTSFNIKADKGSDNVTVAVRTGKVSVFADREGKSKDPEADGLILRANQQADFSKRIEKLTRTLVPEPVPVVSMEELRQFRFKNAPVGEILHALERVYDTEILFDQEQLSECRLTSTLDNGLTLFEKLEVLCEAIDASYKIVDAQVVVSGKRCQ